MKTRKQVERKEWMNYVDMLSILLTNRQIKFYNNIQYLYENVLSPFHEITWRKTAVHCIWSLCMQYAQWQLIYISIELNVTTYEHNDDALLKYYYIFLFVSCDISVPCTCYPFFFFSSQDPFTISLNHFLLNTNTVIQFTVHKSPVIET